MKTKNPFCTYTDMLGLELVLPLGPWLHVSDALTGPPNQQTHQPVSFSP